MIAFTLHLLSLPSSPFLPFPSHRPSLPLVPFFPSLRLVLQKALRDEAMEKKRRAQLQEDAARFASEIVNTAATASASASEERHAGASRQDWEQNRIDPVKDSVEHLPRPQLLQVLSELSSRLAQGDRDRSGLRNRVQELEASDSKLQEFTTKFKELQDAHLQQSRHMQKLQKQQGKIEAFKATIQMQEKVIAKMQTVVEARLRLPVAATGLLPAAAKQPQQGAQDQTEASRSNVPAMSAAVQAELQREAELIEQLREERDNQKHDWEQEIELERERHRETATALKSALENAFKKEEQLINANAEIEELKLQV